MRIRQWALDGVNTKWLTPGRLCFARWWSNVYICGILSLIFPPPGICSLSFIWILFCWGMEGGKIGLYFNSWIAIPCRRGLV
jgi:hypothetical protein